MKRTVVSIMAATTLVAFAACSQSGDETATAEAPAAEETIAVDVPEVPATDTVVAVDGQTAADTGTSVSMSENGVNVSTNDGTTSVDANVDGDPSLKVETN